MLLNENAKLFDKLIPVSLKDAYTSHSRTRQLFLTMEWQDAESSAGMYGSRKELMLSLTDNDDPFFLYSLKLSEEDYQKLKNSQQLLIDFASFPQKFIKYIEDCLLEERNPQPKFSLVFTVNENAGASSKLDIIEAHEVRNLNHLSLEFAAAGDCAVRQYIASCFRQLKEENRNLRSSLTNITNDLQNKLANSQQVLSCKVQEFDSLRREYHAELALKDSKHAKELNEERDQLVSRHKEKVNGLEREIEEKEQKFRKEIQELESTNNCQNIINKGLREEISKYESTVKEWESKAHSLEEEIIRLKDDVEHLKQKCDALQSEVKDKESQIHKQVEEIRELTQKLQSKECSINKLKTQIRSEEESRNSVEKEINDKVSQLEINETTIKELNKEKGALQERIVKMQEKSLKMATDNKAKQQEIQKYKRIAEEKEKAVLEMKKEINEQKRCLESKKTEVNILNISIRDLEEKLNAFEADKKTKEQVIKWLNRQLTDHNLIPQYTAPSNLVRSPDNIASLSNLVPSPSNIAQNKLVQISSPSPESTYPVIAAKKATAKSVRIETPSPLNRKNTTPSGLHKTDSAYLTASPTYTNHTTPEIVRGYHNINNDQNNFEVDQAALSAAFRDENHVLKHSTAKKSSKPTKPVTSTTPRIPKKR